MTTVLPPNSKKRTRPRCPECGTPVSSAGYRCRPCGARKRHADGNGVSRKPTHSWSRAKPPPGALDGTGCVHHFTIPTPDPKVEPVGTCQKCGTTRMHSNVGSGFDFGVSSWRDFKINGPARDDAYRLPLGYHITGPVE